MNHSPCILVVDDNPLVLRASGRILREAGYTVIEASSGAECLRLAREYTPDLILLDVVMDEPNGVEICRQLKADPALAHSFVILFSGIKTESNDQALGIEVGADGYITRPISNRELVARVQGMLRIRAVEDELRANEERLAQMVEERTRELRAAQEQLLRQERLTLLGQIAGGIGHELRGPLSAISNAAYLLRQILAAPDAETREALDILTRQVEASNRIITSLLSFARPQPPVRHPTDVRAVLELALAQAALPDNIVVQREFDDALPEVQADADQLQIVFSNLIRNAAQAMWEQGGMLTISAKQISDSRLQIADSQAEQSEICNLKSAIEIRVTDTGIGIPPEIRDKLFQPLFTTKSRGLGLGLALCKLIVEAHGGTIAVESIVGKGTTFTVTLPAEC